MPYTLLVGVLVVFCAGAALADDFSVFSPDVFSPEESVLGADLFAASAPSAFLADSVGCLGEGEE